MLEKVGSSCQSLPSPLTCPSSAGKAYPLIHKTKPYCAVCFTNPDRVQLLSKLDST